MRAAADLVLLVNRHPAPPAPRVLVLMDAAITGRPCCPDARCRCDCGCRRHSHYRRCAPCALLAEHARPRPEPLTVRSARAFGEWPPLAPAHRLAHLFPAGPRPVEG